MTFTDSTWMAESLCRPELGLSQELWFPIRGASSKPGKEICAVCPVRQQCEDYAFDNGIRHGTYGGLSERQRRTMRRTRPPKPVVAWCAHCNTRFEMEWSHSYTRRYCSKECASASKTIDQAEWRRTHGPVPTKATMRELKAKLAG